MKTNFASGCTSDSRRVMPKKFDVIIVGAGHAGCEAAMALSRLGLKTMLITSNLDRIGHLSCNPAIGGLGKGHMVREIDALGGSMGKWADEAGIQFRTLNGSKGPAVRATRGQMDREVYMNAVKRDIFSQKNLWVFQDMAATPKLSQGRICGITTELGAYFESKAILLTTGTFLSGKIHVGDWKMPAGRQYDAPSNILSTSLKELGIELGRLMTCTTPRIAKNSIDFSMLEEQAGEVPVPRFSFNGPGPKLPQLSCYLGWTNDRSHKVIQDALHLSPMYNGAIPQPGPRYCPSIEDKIARFPDRPRHQIFVEPEGVNSPEFYPNGMPTGLPLSVQADFLHTIPGLEECQILRAGYAIEYDFIYPTQLTLGLEVKAVPGLWSAGQINGSSGYEEAAAQGLWAALNIFCSLTGAIGTDAGAFVPGRDMAYMSVLVDDLVTKGTDEPYRMFTSRAEHRLLLRESNADFRLSELGRKVGLVEDEQWGIYLKKQKEQSELLQELEGRHISPNAEVRAILSELGENFPTRAISLAELLRRPGMDTQKLAAFWPEIVDFSADARCEAETVIVYSGYLQRQAELAARQGTMEKFVLPEIDYASVPGLSREIIEKLSKIKPQTLGQASRISGVTPASLGCIEIYLKKHSMR